MLWEKSSSTPGESQGLFATAPAPRFTSDLAGAQPNGPALKKKKWSGVNQIAPTK